ncbi:MAG: aminomethyl-transferring glycine dehydrogenase [Proteiniphilum sp.]|jgi:glycine dehydrogenase|nr:aminomethyl-transferring glycine dehydrogenase [Proteiniphilum sp.]NCB24519.1 glycine dehydrogenase (aminomethyl-transferring) [Bacteroidia bacterium]MDD3076372.1 aminomethyl-transferring glycine dehydrogenase [Proteiniphilum sp.]MDD3778643.1 aminomethyl-transferring glycine dehydrogenase [Proteiniphilum sp.]MDD3956434.1 aminomethyl-transferring glycine dehydrogenase [Proteiniphilum sp.]
MLKMEQFKNRHIGLSEADKKIMLKSLGIQSIEELIDQTIPADIRLSAPLSLPSALSEQEYAEEIAQIASQNKLFASYIGMGWYDTITPAAIYRNVFENPVWYTSYTPYQAEISQGRLEALLNFQTMVSELTALPLANCSLLDEATAAAEAATMMHGLRSREQVKEKVETLFVDERIFPQTLSVLKTRMHYTGIEIVTGDWRSLTFDRPLFGMILQYPDGEGSVEDYRELVKKAHEADCKVAVATDLMALVLLTPPGEWGADIAFGSSQRFGIPMFYGGPSAAFFATKEEYKRSMPGRIIGISKDAQGREAYRMALQTREQHIKREKATSNICTAQALLATMSSFYAVYHGPEGLKEIARRIHAIASHVSEELKEMGFKQLNKSFFDTLKVALPEGITVQDIRENAEMRSINLRYYPSGEIGISIDETTNNYRVHELLAVFAMAAGSSKVFLIDDLPEKISLKESQLRKTDFLAHPTFHLYHTETELMRYIKRLERKDISLAHSMISLGSCTMKLNAASELLPLGMPGLQRMHPFVPEEQAVGYRQMIDELEEMLAEITGFAATSLQPNSGAAGEYTGLITIGAYLESKGEAHRKVVLIPASAHGTNPASAAQAGFTPVTVASDAKGNVDMDDFRSKVAQHADNLAAYMITYPSTHGIFETEIKEMCRLIHEAGGQVYMDGANMNAQVGYTNPGTIGADVCHLNLHKTFAIPHGGGGPGVGPICVAEHLASFLPGHPVTMESDKNTVSAAAYGSAGVLEITYAYIRMMGAEGLKEATAAAILSANYLAEKLHDSYGIVYRGTNGRVGHELILDCRGLKEVSGITETDIAKRLIDYGYHAPTLSFPVHGTLMVEPTESESLSELNRFVDTMNQIHEEIIEVSRGEYTAEDNVLVNAPHPQYEVTADEWNHAYSRKKAAYPLPFVAENKFWVNVARVDNAYGDRNLVSCLCMPGISE